MKSSLVGVQKPRTRPCATLLYFVASSYCTRTALELHDDRSLHSATIAANPPLN